MGEPSEREKLHLRLGQVNEKIDVLEQAIQSYAIPTDRVFEVTEELLALKRERLEIVQKIDVWKN
jgi:hypothetical protein